jgi:TPR repeat protein
MYCDGRSVKRDLVTAYRLLKGAADEGDADAKKRIPEVRRVDVRDAVQAGETRFAAERSGKSSRP